ncbi:hypothetical protein BDV12DRAFT_140146 [Aspergillus spectabilis]
MPTPGVLMRLSDAPSGTLRAPLPGVDAAYTLKADDGQNPPLNTIYFLGDITPLLTSTVFYDADVAAHRDVAAPAPSWVLCSFINARDTPGDGEAQTSPHVLPMPPARGSVLVINGSTPRPEKEGDYHAWYDQEHGAKLTLVPGWRAARRYALARVYGEVETASFYGFNFYEAENGLGGPEWHAGVTEWTLRIRSNAAKPNLRRVWKVVETA